MNTLWLCSHHILVDLIIIKNILATPLGWSIRVLQKICWHKWHVKGYISCLELSSCIVSHNQTTKPAPLFSSGPFLGRGFIECFCLNNSLFSTLSSLFESHFVREQWVALLTVHHEVLAVYFFQHVQTFANFVSFLLLVHSVPLSSSVVHLTPKSLCVMHVSLPCEHLKIIFASLKV